ncbi:AraC family transcriptional regulator [Clostridium polynesiense]|uniref:AraC family transcriptional regulator n=1 Tax=Clostridium polynesiense TaxID=1325933 RepID=UPI00058C5649|nr:AraC family transcriptional regulator [Clostridium polynesiense]
MEWINCLNKAIQYIEEHLIDEIEIEKAAQIALCSTFHFQRMFSYMADVTLSEYIRRRRMTKAASDLQKKTNKVLDIALKYGYESPTAFNRAFQSIHGITPSAARKSGAVLKSYPPISFTISIKGDTEMNYKIEKKNSFRIVGVKEHYTEGIDQSFAKVPMFWHKAGQSGLIPSLCSLMDKEPFGVLGVCTSASNKDFDYYIAAATDKPSPSQMEEFIIPETNWAIFECIGAMPQAIQKLQKRIITEWLPTSGYEYANAPDIEVYFDGDQSSEDYKCEVWLPIIKK